MRFLSIYQKDAAREEVPPTEQQMVTMGKFIEEAVRAGVLLATDGCLPSQFGARVRLAPGGTFKVTDGPFTESKELVAGIAILQCKTKDEAIEWTKRFMKMEGDGHCEIRQLPDHSPMG